MATKPSVSRKAKKVSKTPSVAQVVADSERDAPAQARAPSQAVAPAQSTPQDVTAVVGKIGWENGNESNPIVLIDKKLRAKLGVEIREPVVVSKGETKKIAMVALQFWELVGTGKATINGNLAQAISAEMGSEIKISKLSDAERVEFERAQQARIGAFMANLAGALSQGRAGEGE